MLRVEHGASRDINWLGAVFDCVRRMELGQEVTSNASVSTWPLCSDLDIYNFQLLSNSEDLSTTFNTLLWFGYL